MATSNLKQYNRRDIRLINQIGEGAFGVVYKGVINGTTIAIKQVKDVVAESYSNVNVSELKDVENEISMLASLRHPNIVSLLGISGTFSKFQVPWMIFEFMPDGCLQTYLTEHSVTEGLLIKFCYDICEGMKFLHSKGVCHRDLAARNVLLDVSKNLAKVSDLGMSTIAKTDPGKPYCVSSFYLGPAGTPVYHAAKECFTEGVFSSATDVWSFGVTMCEIFNGGCPPYPGISPEGARDYIRSGKNPLYFINLHISSEILNVVKRIFRVNREERPSFKALSTTFNQLRTIRFPQVIPSGNQILNRARQQVAQQAPQEGNGGLIAAGAAVGIAAAAVIGLFAWNKEQNRR